MKQETRKALTGYAFLAPWLIAMVFLIGYPFAASIYFSTCEYPPLTEPVFVGLENYQELTQDDTFRTSMIVTIIFAVVAIPLGVLLALALALSLNSRIQGRSSPHRPLRLEAFAGRSRNADSGGVPTSRTRHDSRI